VATRCCPDLDRDDVDALAAHVRAEPWLIGVLDAVSASELPDAWIGAGILRDLVWGHLHDGFDPAAVRDIDVAFFDPDDLSRHRDEAAQQCLESIMDRPWEATNQAAVHTWYAEYFHAPPIPPLGSVHEAIATWPETATCVAIRSTVGGIEVCAPYGLDDLLGGVWRRNPARISVAASTARLARHRVPQRWPTVVVHDPARP
jgi:hypothetical protein